MKISQTKRKHGKGVLGNGVGGVRARRLQIKRACQGEFLLPFHTNRTQIEPDMSSESISATLIAQIVKCRDIG